MKIHKIKIENIASIADSTINFDCPEIASQPLFLISGDMGTGKTTILNSICLALYDDVPALRTIGSTDGGDLSGLSVTNTRQFVRRGAARGSVMLWYEGIDGQEYRVSWLARRARGKLTGNWQNIERALEHIEYDANGDEISVERFFKKHDIDYMVKRTVGLSFDQFTRTTLLAQGQFASFMKASDKDKAQILEKLTGTDIYASIGRKVNELAKEKDNEFSILNAKISDVKLLDEAERCEISARIALLSCECDKLKSDIDLCIKKRDWLLQDEKLSLLLNEKIDAENTAEAVVKSDEYIEYRSCLNDWILTSDLRVLIGQRNALEEKYRSLISDSRAIMMNEYRVVSNGLLWFGNNITSMTEKLSKINAAIDMLKDYNVMIENAQRISGLADAIADAQNNLNVKSAELNTISRQISNNQKITDTMTEARTHAENELEESEKTLAIKEIDAERYKLTEISSERDALISRVLSLNKGKNVLAKFDETSSELKNISDSLNTNEVEITECLKMISECEYKSVSLESDYFRCKGRMEGEMELHDHIVSLRRRYAETKVCPLCGTPDVHLCLDDEINDKLHEASEALTKSEKLMNENKSLLEKSRARLKILIDNGEQLKNKCKQKNSQLKVCLEAIRSSSMELGIELQADGVDDLLDKMLLDAEKQVDECKRKLVDATNSHTQLATARKYRDKCRLSVDKADAELRKHLEDCRQIADEDASCKSAIEMYREIISKNLSEMESFLSDDFRTQLSVESAGAMAERIVCLKASRDELLESASSLAYNITKAEADYNELSTLMIGLDAMFTNHIPAVKYEPTPEYMGNIKESTYQLRDNMITLSASISENRDTVAEIDGRIESGLSEVGLEIEKVREISAWSPEQVANWDKFVKDADMALRVANDARREALRQQEMHRRCRPDIGEGSVDIISEEISIKSKLRDDALTECGVKKRMLQTDAEAAKRLSDDLVKLEQLRVDRNDWAILDSAFGGADGVRFRKKAQSYVLSLLLANANYYLQQLSPRYSLTCMPDSLAINVVDSWQGDSERNVGMLSGGEGFVVSLALALGLASISKEKIDVDTLFIDEGFGSLDRETLDVVINTLDRLHQLGGRRIGIISHVQELKERIPVQICVERVSPGISRCELRTLS